MVDIQITVFDRQVKPDPFPEPLGLKIKRSITSVLSKLPVEQNDYNNIPSRELTYPPKMAF